MLYKSPVVMISFGPGCSFYEKPITIGLLISCGTTTTLTLSETKPTCAENTFPSFPSFYYYELKILHYYQCLNQENHIFL